MAKEIKQLVVQNPETGFTHEDGQVVFVDSHNNVVPVDELVADQETVINHQILDVSPTEVHSHDDDDEEDTCVNCDTKYVQCPNCGRIKFCPDCEICKVCERSNEFDLTEEVIAETTRTKHRRCRECHTELQECPECNKVKLCAGCGVCTSCGYTI